MREDSTHPAAFVQSTIRIFIKRKSGMTSDV